MIKYIVALGVAITLSCCKDSGSENIVVNREPTDINLSFESSLVTIEEGQSLEVMLSFASASLSEGSVEISFSSDNAVYGEDFTAEPVFSNGLTTINYAVGAESISFQVNTLIDEDEDVELLNFNISSTSEGISFNSNNELVVKIEDKSDGSTTSEDVLSVATWNIERYPKNGSSTINAVKDLIEGMDVDIIALQEINDIPSFDALVAALDGWEGKLYDVRRGIELAYLYKTSEITSFSNLSVIYNDDSDAFPRQPVLATATHTNGLEVTIINIHLKCCGVTGSGEANRREAASKALETYIDTNLSSDNVMVVGDWNDDISDGPFDNFLSNSDNYVFADFDIGEGSIAYWSYPDWPSHLDHILITNELTDNLISTETLRLEDTYSNYESNVSDHRPVVANFSN